MEENAETSDMRAIWGEQHSTKIEGFSLSIVAELFLSSSTIQLFTFESERGEKERAREITLTHNMHAALYSRSQMGASFCTQEEGATHHNRFTSK